MEYFPALSARQVKMVIEKSAKKPAEKVNNPGTDKETDMQEISKTGGIINAYDAIKLASTLKGERKPAKPATKVTPKKKQ